MEWYEVDKFADRIAKIEEFFVEIAANQERVAAFGFKEVNTFSSAKSALDALNSFNEDFFGLRRCIQNGDKGLAFEVDVLATKVRLGKVCKTQA